MNNSKKHLALLSVLLCLLLIAFSGCTPVEHLQSDYQIVTSFYPMYLFTRNLTEGISGVTVVNMTAQNAGCLHDYQLLSKDMKALGAADAFVINGAGMEGFLEKVIEQLPSLPVITASEGIEILCENAEHEHEEEQAHGHAGHEHEENAHVWLSVPNAIAEVNNIAAGLKKLLPGNEAQIERNRSAFA
jgi:zinc transport system substrate-binding protein